MLLECVCILNLGQLKTVGLSGVPLSIEIHKMKKRFMRYIYVHADITGYRCVIVKMYVDLAT